MQRAGAVALLAVALAMASLVQGPGWNQNAHLGLVRALSHGTAVVDDYREGTGDLARHDGHYYSAKAPGVALLAVGPYVVLDRTGALDAVSRATGIHRDDVDLWALAAIVCALAAAITLVLVRRLGDEVARGYGIAAAVTLGLATLLLPFATLLFAHVPAAALAFGAFALLWLRGAPWAALAAGVLAGMAVTVEYPLALAAVVLGLYVITEEDRLRRGLAFAAGVAAGVSPLLAYNAWAFDSPLHFPYEDALPIAGLASNERGFFGISWPSPETALRLLVDERGLLVVTPVVLCAVAALVPLYRRGWRREAVLIGGLAVAFLVYNAGYDVPFGGDSPGPRFLIAVLPFLAVPLALAYELWTRVTVALALVSAVYAVGITLTGPLQAFGWEWVGDVPGTATALEAVRFLPLVVTGAVLAALSVRAARGGDDP
ncbi:MAG TPA: hypothetical protein VFR32_02740 [Gaiellaceae bacterium]|nr:hypothetical protein [Gaiellaceae bacterium]